MNTLLAVRQMLILRWRGGDSLLLYMIAAPDARAERGLSLPLAPSPIRPQSRHYFRRRKLRAGYVTLRPRFAQCYCCHYATAYAGQYAVCAGIYEVTRRDTPFRHFMAAACLQGNHTTRPPRAATHLGEMLKMRLSRCHAIIATRSVLLR